jgi:hypothetical protein
MLPARRLVLARGVLETLKIGGVTFTFSVDDGAIVVASDSGRTTLEPAALGFAPLSVRPDYQLAFPRAFAWEGRTSVFIRSATVRKGKLGDDTLRVYDVDLDGAYRKGADGMAIGDDGAVGVFAPIAELIPTSTGVYRVDAVDPAGQSVTLSPHDGPVGRLGVRTSADVECRLAFASEDGESSCAMLAGERPVVLSVGRWHVRYGYLYDAARKRVAAIVLPGDGPAITVKTGAEVTVTLSDTVIERAIDQGNAPSLAFATLLEIDLSDVEAAADTGDFRKARTLLDEARTKYQDSPNLEATRAWVTRLTERLALETSPEGSAFREVESKIVAAAKAGDLARVKALAADGRKAFDRIPAKFADTWWYRVRNTRAEAFARWAEGARPGLHVTYFAHKFSRVTGREIVERVDWDGSPGGGRKQFFCCRYEGYLVVPEDGEYELAVASDEGARLFLDESLVLDHWQAHVMSEKSARLTLTAGIHALKLESYQGLGDAGLHLLWTPPGRRKSVVPSWALECRGRAAR